MTYRLLTLCLEKESSAKLLTDAAAAIAGNNDTRVNTIHVTPSGFDYLPMSPYAMAVPLASLQQKYDEIADGIKSHYEKHQVAHPTSITWDWKLRSGTSLGDFSDYVTYAIASDLVICAIPSDSALGLSMAKELLTGTATPVLIVPEQWEQPIQFERIMIAWSETAESARAIRDALPLLQKAKHVELVHFSEYANTNDDKIVGAEIGRYLAEHGVDTTVCHLEQENSVGKSIVKRAESENMDLVVMGGFGHSSLYNFAFGAATPQVLRELNRPVFLSR